MSQPPLSGSHADGVRLIGPNALIQTAAALYALEGASAVAVLAAAGEQTLSEQPPDDRVDERRFSRLVAALVAQLGEARAELVLAQGGALTADHLLTHQLPAPFQSLLRRLPRDQALRLLLGAVASHARAFVGSGRLRYELPQLGRVELTIDGCPACRGLTAARPMCGFYAGIFERLFRTLVDDGMRVTETGCQACGGASCTLLAVRTDDGDDTRRVTGP